MSHAWSAEERRRQQQTRRDEPSKPRQPSVSLPDEVRAAEIGGTDRPRGIDGGWAPAGGGWCGRATVVLGCVEIQIGLAKKTTGLFPTMPHDNAM